MVRRILPKVMMLAGALAGAALPVAGTAALAQIAPPGYNPQPQQPAPPPGTDYRNPPLEPAAPAGYDGKAPPPPPPGYQTPADPAAQAAQYEADQRYAAEAQRWARDNCVKSEGNPATGALVGGILGAIVGGAMGGRHGGGGAVLAGTVIGAAGGAAVASTSGGETSPGCPPGYVVRRDAPPYAYPAPGYYYAAPGWYAPWVFVDGFWVFRPYPYHDYYWHTYRGPYWHGGYRGGYHGGGRRHGY